MAIRVAYLLGRFPVLYERALLEEIAACIRTGIDGRIIAFSESGESLPEALRLLAERTDYLDIARKAGRFVSGIAGIGAGLGHALGSPQFACACAGYSAGGGINLFARRVQLAQCLENMRPDIVHAQFGHLGACFLPAIQRTDLPLIVSFRGQDVTIVSRASKKTRRDFFDHVSRVLVRCQTMAEDVVHLGCPKEKIHVLPSGIILDDIPFSRRSAPADKCDTTVLMASRLVAKKGMDDGLRALARCGKDQKLPQIRIAGDGPERKSLEHLAKKLGIANRTKFLGAISRNALLEEMTAAHVFLLPCKTAPDGETEGIPNVIKEALAAGLPVVSTRHSGIPECVIDGINGFLADEGDLAGLADALNRILSMPERWGEFGEQGRTIVKKRFEMSGCVTNLLEHYRALANM